MKHIKTPKCGKMEEWNGLTSYFEINLILDALKFKLRINLRYAKFDLAFLENPFSVVLEEWVEGGGEVSNLIKWKCERIHVDANCLMYV